MTDDEVRDTLRLTRAYLRWLQRENHIIIRDREPREATPTARPTASMPPAPAPRAPARPAATTSAAPPRRGTVVPVTTDTGPPGSPEWEALRATVASCRKCALGSTRKNAVFGAGNPEADLVFIGEAPGATEDETGVPFVGQAGNQLTKELAKHGITREEVFICNILKCRPPNNRDPLPEEIIACEQHLLAQLRMLKPKMLCALGRFAVATLLKHPVSIMKIRGTWERYNDIPLFVCLHPAAILHQPQNRPLFEADIKALADTYHGRQRA